MTRMPKVAPIDTNELIDALVQLFRNDCGKELDAAVQAVGSNVTGIQGDVAKLTDLDRRYEAVKSKGRIDVVFANGGVAELRKCQFWRLHLDSTRQLVLRMFQQLRASRGRINRSGITQQRRVTQWKQLDC